MTINKGKTNEELVERYKARLEARKQEPKIIGPVIVPGEPGLVYAIGSEIYLLNQHGNDIKIAERDSTVNALCVDAGELYDAGDYGSVYETLDNLEVWNRDIPINALCSHKGNLYFAEGSTIGDMNPRPDWKPITEREGEVKALCSHDGKLLDVGDYDDICNTLEDRTERGLDYEAASILYSYNTNLYCVKYGELVVELDTPKRRTTRPGIIRSLCGYNGKLYDAGDYAGIHETFGSSSLDMNLERITAMCAVPSNIVHKILEEKAV
ncbi:hypothetical protein GOV06_04150 [Candidatus Woesearchaeota archaeon]|nr:hypothetical protein [Candidatus Woesearchaeota archaeon]